VVSAPSFIFTFFSKMATFAREMPKMLKSRFQRSGIRFFPGRSRFVLPFAYKDGRAGLDFVP
jgi:hypothetical protein